MSVKWASGSFAIIPEWVLDADISDRGVRLFGVLARYADVNGNSHPGRKRICERLRCSDASLQRALNELLSLGAVTVTKRHKDDGSLTSSEYVLHAGGYPHGRQEVPSPVTGELEPLNESPSTDATHPPMARVSAQSILGDCIDYARSLNVEPTNRVKGQLARSIKELHDEGKTPEEILDGFGLMLSKGKVAPHLLGHFIMEATLPKQTPMRYGRGLTAKQILGR